MAIGIVKDREDPTGQGRVKLSFPWMTEDHDSAWAPIAAPLAGQERGQWFMPEVGDEALVGFELGDFAHPFVIGFLWNGVDKPADTDPENRVIVTPGGHELRFEDKEGAKQVILKTDGGHSVEMTDKDKKVTVKTSGGHKIELSDMDKKITIQSTGGSSITLDDTMSSVTMKGGGRQIELSSGQVKIT